MRPDATLPPFACALLLGMAQQTVAGRAPDTEIGGAADPYLRRWHLQRGEDGGIYLHEFCRSDDPRAMHDHPWESVSIVLQGTYRELMPGCPAALRMAGDVVSRGAPDLHRIELLPGPDGRPLRAWTLFIVGPRVRNWGFACPNGWVPWERFTAGKDGELIGRGCDQ